jgi:hypothetical protein
MQESYLLLFGDLSPEKAVHNWKKHKFKLEWNYLGEIVQFRGLLYDGESVNST